MMNGKDAERVAAERRWRRKVLLIDGLFVVGVAALCGGLGATYGWAVGLSVFGGLCLAAATLGGLSLLPRRANHEDRKARRP
jgi:uncharacterized protein (DUF58 family)